MEVVIHCGGNGTCMCEETEYRPKTLVNIAATYVDVTLQLLLACLQY